MGKPVVKSHHFDLIIGNVAILLGLKKWKSIINTATRWCFSASRKADEYQLLNANLQVYPKILNFTIFSFIIDYFLLSTKEATSGHSLPAETLAFSPLCQTSQLHHTVPPSSASYSILSSGCQVNNLSWHLPFPPLSSSPHLHQEI